jgi:YbgC/YbaW family acyl-CoA thioester hydrolase
LTANTADPARAAPPGPPGQPSRASFRHIEPLRVRWAEVDLQKIVFNGHYLMYFDTAVAGYWRAMALPYHDTMQHLDGDLYVRKATVEYLGSARYDDVVHCGVRLARLGRSSLTLQCALFRRESLLVHGELVYVFANPATATSQPIADSLRHTMISFEAGKPMVSADTAAWPSVSARVQGLRASLEAQEAQVLALSMQGREDRHCHHVVLTNTMGATVALARWCLHGEGARIDGVTVAPSLRGSGLGVRLLRDSVDSVRRSMGVKAVYLTVPPSLSAWAASASSAAIEGLEVTLANQPRG